MQRRRFNQTTTLDQRLEEQAERLRKKLRASRPSLKRDIMIRKARHAETGARIQDWLKSTGLRPLE
jgi:hypothetical protein